MYRSTNGPLRLDIRDHQRHAKQRGHDIATLHQSLLHNVHRCTSCRFCTYVTVHDDKAPHSLKEKSSQDIYVLSILSCSHLFQGPEPVPSDASVLERSEPSGRSRRPSRPYRSKRCAGQFHSLEKLRPERRSFHPPGRLRCGTTGGRSFGRKLHVSVQP